MNVLLFAILHNNLNTRKGTDTKHNEKSVYSI